MALPVSVIGRQLSAKFLLLGFSQMHNPVRKGVETLLDQNPFQTVPAQLGANPQRSLTPCGMIGDKIFRIAPVIEQFFGAQRIEQRRDDRSIVTFLEQLTVQIRRRMVAAG